MEWYFLEHLPKGGARAARSQNLHMVCLGGSWRGKRVSKLLRGACRRGWECQRRDRTYTHTQHLFRSDRLGFTAATELRPVSPARRRVCNFPSLQRRRRRHRVGAKCARSPPPYLSLGVESTLAPRGGVSAGTSCARAPNGQFTEESHPLATANPPRFCSVQVETRAMTFTSKSEQANNYWWSVMSISDLRVFPPSVYIRHPNLMKHHLSLLLNWKKNK